MINLPWPSKELSPNARLHWAVKARHVKAYRKAAGWATIESKCKAGAEGAICLHITFRPPSKRKFDLDGLLSRIKSGLDGIADGLGVDDVRFKLQLEIGEPDPAKCGVVCVVIK